MRLAVLFPLTPTLSLGERELPRPCCDKLWRRGFSKDRVRCPPLPKGEVGVRGKARRTLLPGWYLKDAYAAQSSEELANLAVSRNLIPPGARPTLHPLYDGRSRCELPQVGPG